MGQSSFQQIMLSLHIHTKKNGFGAFLTPVLRSKISCAASGRLGVPSLSSYVPTQLLPPHVLHLRGCPPCRPQHYPDKPITSSCRNHGSLQPPVTSLPPTAPADFLLTLWSERYFVLLPSLKSHQGVFYGPEM